MTSTNEVSEKRISDYVTARILENCLYKKILHSKNPDDYPRWYSYECSINDPYAKISDLINAGYLQQCQTEDILNGLKLSDLKNILSEHNLPVKGKKIDLIAKIIQEIQPSAISLPPIYETTEKGKQFLKNNKELLIAGSFRKYHISIDEYYQAKSELPIGTDASIIAISIIKERICGFTSDNTFGSLRNSQLYVAQLAQNIEDWEESLKFYLFTAYYDLCENTKFDCGEVEIAPAVVDGISDMKSYFSLSMLSDCLSLYVPTLYSRPDEIYFKKRIEEIVCD